MHFHSAAVIFHESELSESVHEEADARSGCAYHFGEGLLGDLGNHLSGLSSLPKWASSRSILASLFSLELKSWSTKIFFIADIAGQQMRDEQVG